jgi:Uncharacterized protein conserved in bacteria (DUF2169)
MPGSDDAAVGAPRLSMVNVVDHPRGGSQVGVVAKRTYRVSGGRCLPADEQVSLVDGPRFSSDRSALLHDLDCVLHRTEADVIVDGNARPPRVGIPSFEMRVRVGTLDRTFLVFGERRCYRDAGGRLRFSAATPVEAVPLDWTTSYGGFDAVALERNGDPLLELKTAAKEPYSPRFGKYAYPRNRAGKGYLIEATNEALEACTLPNLEEPRLLLTPERLAIGAPERWPTAPIVAATGWLSYANFPRAAMLGMPPLYDPAACPPASFFEVKIAALSAASIAPATPFAKRLDLRVAQQSAVGMRVTEVAPGAPVAVVNAHPKRPLWDFSLSRELPLFALQMPGAKPIRLEPKIRTVYIQPDLDRVSIVWVGEHEEPTPVGPGKRALIKHAVEWRG